MLVITTTGILSGGILAYVYKTAQPRIKEQQKLALKRSLLLVLPGSAKFIEEKVGDEWVYKGLNRKGEVVGLAFQAEGTGFQGMLKLLIGCDRELTHIKRVTIMESVETPGLGSKVGEDKFLGQLKGMSLEESIECIKNRKPEKRNQVQAVTGATISSQAVVTIINRKMSKVRSLLKE